MIRLKKIKKELQVLGLPVIIFANALSLASCSTSELNLAQNNINNCVTTILNTENIQNEINNPVEKFTFLCADIGRSTNDSYNIDINGVSNYKNNKKKGYTTLSYQADASYFNSGSTKDEASLINAISDIVTNEKYISYSIINVNNLSGLNESLGKNTRIPLADYKYSNNFLYKIENIQFSENESIASFSSSELTTFYESVTYITNSITFINNNPVVIPVTSVYNDYQSFYFDHNVKVKLSPKEFEQAKSDTSIIFDKFVEYVDSKQTDKFVIRETDFDKNKEFNSNTSSIVDLEKI